MKNILLKSAQIFVMMAISNFLLSVLMLYIFDLPGGSFGMHPVFVLMHCSIASFIAFITVVIFKKNYYSVLRVATLFQTIYLIGLILSGLNPFGFDAFNTFSLLIFINSFIVFLMIYLLHLWYSKKFNQNIS